MKRAVCGLAWLLAAGVSLAADWQQGAGFRSVPLEASAPHQAGFTLLPAISVGITFTNWITEQRHLTNQILLNGSGVAAGDVDGDGRCDLYFCSIDGPNKLYRNLGNWKFEDITDAAGVACPNLDATGAAFADLDGDGDLDLIVNSIGGGTHVFLNDGKGHFTHVAQLNGRKGGMSLALADVDGNGYLDLYIANYRTSALMDMPNARAVFKPVNGKNTIDKINGRPLTDPDLTNRFNMGPRGTIEELGEVDGFYLNRGGTNFTEVPFTSGRFLDEEGKPLTSPPFDWGLTAAFRDLNGDGWPDLYVCNDFETPDRFWINQRNGKFQEAPRLAQRKSSLFSMGVDFADLNRDGQDDFFVLDMLNREHALRLTQMLPLPPLPAEIVKIEGRPQYMMSTLFLNRGDGTFAEIAQLAGLEASNWSWSPAFLDVDLDGYEDFLVVTGHERAARDLDVADQMKALRRGRRNLTDNEIFQARRAFPRLATGNLAFRNRGDLTFEEVSEKWGFAFHGVSQALALADLDNDGDLDVIINNSNDAPCLYRNDTGAARIAVRLKGTPPNTHGIGAKIRVLGGAVPMQSQEIMCGGRYLSCDEAMRVFAAGQATNDLRIEVNWRSGQRSVVDHASANRLYEIDEAAAVNGPTSRAADQVLPAPLFEDASVLLNHVHHDDPFDDFQRQPLLPNKLSQLGPGVSWCDLNGDGWEDLLIGSGKGGKFAAYLNNGHGQFRRIEEPPFTAPITRDQTAVLGWVSGADHVTILAGSANYEDGLPMGGAVKTFDPLTKAAQDTCPAAASSVGPLALADVDGDGYLDLFVGGRCVPGKYPEAAESVLYRNVNGKLQLDPENTKQLANVGLVSGAVFSDLDGDGQPELVLACDWGPIRVFRNQHGQLVEATQSLKLDQFKGWWNGVAIGDFDGDGRLDIVASNWGRNTKYQSYRTQALSIYYGDFNGDGTEDLIEAYFDPQLHKVVPERQLNPMDQAMPFLRAKFSSHQAYAQASVEDLLGDRFRSAKVREANWLETTLFLNRGDHFEAHPLPVEAQMAPAFGLCVGDCDGDGNEDIFLAQNFFATQPETPRYDAGRGLWLRGDGQGRFSAAPGQNSGIKVYGEQRGCALADYDHDGRVDLVVTQNGAETRLYHNVGARPGLRVQLQGNLPNPLAIGAALRLEDDQGKGPVREVHAGSGYWSQDSAAQVLCFPRNPARVWVRWPGGKETLTPIPLNARQLHIDSSGKITHSE